MTLEGFTEPWPLGLTMFYLWPARDGDRKVETKSISLRWLISWGPWVSQAPWWCPWRGTNPSHLQRGLWRQEVRGCEMHTHMVLRNTVLTDMVLCKCTLLNLDNDGITQNCIAMGLSFLHIYIYSLPKQLQRMTHTHTYYITSISHHSTWNNK